MQILFPMLGGSTFFGTDEYPYPKPIIEVAERPMVELCLENFEPLESKRLIFVINARDDQRYHLGATLKLLSGDDPCVVKPVSNVTKGAACTALLAIDSLNPEEELIVSNFDQVISDDLDRIVAYFRSEKADAGVITFDSVHPKWAFVRLEGNVVLETSEKRPISRNAIAGFYYFRRAADFLDSAMAMIKKDASVDGQFYVAPSLNELILANKRVIAWKLSGSDKYHSFYSPQKISEFEKGARYGNVKS